MSFDELRERAQMEGVAVADRRFGMAVMRCRAALRCLAPG